MGYDTGSGSGSGRVKLQMAFTFQLLFLSLQNERRVLPTKQYSCTPCSPTPHQLSLYQRLPLAVGNCTFDLFVEYFQLSAEQLVRQFGLHFFLLCSSNSNNIHKCVCLCVCLLNSHLRYICIYYFRRIWQHIGRQLCTTQMQTKTNKQTSKQATNKCNNNFLADVCFKNFAIGN